MKKHLIITLILLTVCVHVAQALVLSTFGSTATAAGSAWTYTPGTSALTGFENIGDNLYNVNPLANLNLTGLTTISLTANATTAPTGAFTITLSDNAGRVASASFLWTAFTIGPKTITSPLTAFQSGFNIANITDFSIDSGGSAQALNVSFSSVSAVAPIPEPSTYALMAMGALVISGVSMKRRTAKNLI